MIRYAWGHSMLVDRWGVLLSERAEGQGDDVVALELSRLQQVRLQLPALEHRVL